MQDVCVLGLLQVSHLANGFVLPVHDVLPQTYKEMHHLLLLICTQLEAVWAPSSFWAFHHLGLDPLVSLRKQFVRVTLFIANKHFFDPQQLLLDVCFISLFPTVGHISLFKSERLLFVSFFSVWIGSMVCRWRFLFHQLFLFFFFFLFNLNDTFNSFVLDFNWIIFFFFFLRFLIIFC